MYKSATVKLTAWYLLILMSISLLFSVVIYNVAQAEVNTRLQGLQQNLQNHADYSFPPRFDFRSLRAYQAQQASVNLLISLFYTNILIFVGGGIGSYLLARRTLLPIERSYEAQSRFTSDASHELRTPLAAMKTELEVALRSSALSKDEMKELLESNLEEVDKLTQLSYMLLQISRLENVDLETGKVDVTATAQGVITRYDKTGTRIHLVAPEPPLHAAANEVSLEELMTILVDNAVKYSPDDSVVDLTIGSKNKLIIIEVKNSGQGIDAKDLPHIFDRFYRVDTSRTGGTKSGYGLGLSLARRIVELHNGDLIVSSSPGGLTTFTVQLPKFTTVPAKTQ